MDKDVFFGSAIDVIADLQDDPAAVDVLRDPIAGPHVNLFDAGLLRSLTVVRVLVALEERYDVSVPIGQYGMEAFFTLDNMYRMISEVVDGDPRGADA